MARKDYDTVSDAEDSKSRHREETSRSNDPSPEVYAQGITRSMMDRDAVKVIRRLSSHGYRAFLVGGGVRDLLLGRKPKDFDVATSALPHDVRRLFRNCRVIGRRFRLAHVLFSGGKIIEVATFRKDPDQRYEERGGDDDTPVRLVPIRRDSADEADLLIRNDNVFGHPHEDAIRRDFTINGLFYDLERQEVIDYVGGMDDLDQRVLRTIGDPDVRFREDPIRILRAIKFSARLDFGLDPDLYDAITEIRGELSRAARPRLLEELLRLLRGGAAQRSIFLCQDTGVLAMIMPELAGFLDDDPTRAELTYRRLEAIDRMQRRDSLPTDAVLVSALLLGPIYEWIEGERDVAGAFHDFMVEVAERLAMPRRLRDRMRIIISCQRRLRLGRLGSLPRREFFGDAATLFRIECEAQGEDIPDWALGSLSETEAPAPRRQRRRRRRRRN